MKRLKAAILISRENWHVGALCTALNQRGCQVSVLPVAEMTARVGGRPALACGAVALDEFDAVLVRGIPGGSAEQLIYRMDALQTLERRGVRVINSPRSIERSVDKYLTSALLEEAGIPTPATVVAQGFTSAMDAFLAMGDVVAKPLFGSEGRGMVRLTDPDTAYRVLRTWEQIGAIFYLQEFIAHANRDLRALVVGEQVVAAMERTAATWKTNVSQGATARPVQLSPHLADLAVRAARAVGAGYAGVDLLPAEDGRVLVPEINSIPGWAGLQRTTSLDIADLIAAHALEGLS